MFGTCCLLVDLTLSIIFLLAQLIVHVLVGGLALPFVIIMLILWLCDVQAFLQLLPLVKYDMERISWERGRSCILLLIILTTCFRPLESLYWYTWDELISYLNTWWYFWLLFVTICINPLLNRVMELCNTATRLWLSVYCGCFCFQTTFSSG